MPLFLIFVYKIRYKYFFEIIKFLIVLIVVFNIPSISSLISSLIISSISSHFSEFKSSNNLLLLNSIPFIIFASVFNLSILSIFFLVSFLNSIISLILIGLPQNLFFNSFSFYLMLFSLF